jgi:lysine 2,3-aminomutase
MQEKINITKDQINNEEISKLLLEKWNDWKWQVKNTIRRI